MLYELSDMREFIRPCKAELRKHGYTDEQLNVERVIARAEVLYIGGHTGLEAAAIILSELESGVL